MRTRLTLIPFLAALLFTTTAANPVSASRASTYHSPNQAAPSLSGANGLPVTGTFKTFCEPGFDGATMACPCANPPSGPGRGCNNFSQPPGTGGASISMTGTPSVMNDPSSPAVLTISEENHTFALTVLWAGDTLLAPGGVFNGAGVRCVAQPNRFYIGNADQLGTFSRPRPGIDQTLTQLDPTVVAGSVRYYYSTYRDPHAAGPCGSTSSTINASNAGAVTWGM